MAQPLPEALKVGDSDPLIWTGDCQRAFQDFKEKLVTAPALQLPDLKKSLDLFVHERKEHWDESSKFEKSQRLAAYF